MARLEAPVMNTSRVAPAESASSTAYWIRGLSTTGSISLGLALVAGRNRVPRPATGNTAVRMADVEFVLIKFFSCGLPLRSKSSVQACSKVYASAQLLLRPPWPLRQPSVRSAHLKTAGRMLSHERHLGQCQYQPTLCSPQSSH